jgi:hypothetical protein
MVRSGSDKLFAFSGESSYFDSDNDNKEELYDLARSVVVDQVEVAPSATFTPFLVWNPEFTTGIRHYVLFALVTLGSVFGCTL